MTPEHVTTILMNLNGIIIESKSFKYSKVKDFDEAVQHIERNILSILEGRQIPKKKVLGIGLSLPGLVEEEKLILDNAPNLGVKEI